MSNIEAIADDLFKTISAYVDKRVAAAVEKMAGLEKRLDELPTPKDGVDGRNGIDGKDGAQGIDGKDGMPGKDAEPIDFDAVVKSVVSAIPVPVNGKDGAAGEDGRDGRDAIQCDVLDVIDPERRYQRGTFATYKGGLIRAFRATDPMGDSLEKAGWAVIVEGVEEVGVEQGEDLRTFAIGVQLTSGKAFAHKFVSPVMMHRGVFKAGTDYTRGDVTTWDGSSWHCEHETKAEPGNSPDWKLIAKRGSNGKDAVPIKGEPGPPGKNGRDATQIGPNGGKW